MRRLEEYISPDRTPYFYPLRFLSSPLICDISFSFPFIHDKRNSLLRPLVVSAFCSLMPFTADEVSTARKLKYADFYGCKGRRREDDEKTKDMEGLDHKGCGRLDFTGRRVLGNYRTFKIQKVLIARYSARDTSVVKSSVFNTVTHTCKQNYKKYVRFLRVYN